jgi:acetyl esterase/lipase
MPLKSDITFDTSKLDPNAISPETTALNESLMELGRKGPKWYEVRSHTKPCSSTAQLTIAQVGAEKYRQMRWNGETPMPRPKVVESGRNIKLPSRDSGREIPCRVFVPENGTPKAVFYHIHGGGWVLQSEHYQDLMLDWIAQNCQVTVVSVGYRLAPEDPYPAGNDDCEDVAAWLVDHAQAEYGAPLAFMGGDSAGGHLSVVTCFRLLKSKPSFAFKALVLNFGCFDLAGFMPHTHHFDMPLILTKDIMLRFIRLPFARCTEQSS